MSTLASRFLINALGGGTIQYLLLIALGPVQDFIATARKTRDLWFGSYLLSECSKAVARHLDSGGATLIFPNPEDAQDLQANQPHGLNVSNIILSKIDALDAESAKQIAINAVQAAKDHLKTVRDHALSDAFRVVNAEAAKQQLEDLIESYWSVTHLESEQDYPSARIRLVHALDSRKATRNFAPAGAWSKAGVTKSSLDGSREIVTPDNDSALKRLGLKRGERLCGVGLLKRLGMRSVAATNRNGLRFFSTSSVAAAPLFTDQNRARLLEYFQSINDLAGGSDADLLELTGAALFESRLDEMLDNSDLDKSARDQLVDSAKRLLKTTLDDITGNQTITPLPYYALLLGDGDNMGKVIDHLGTIESHQQFSCDLARFATSARTTVEQHSGCLIYAGGDDVLALLPLHTALKAAKQLSLDFSAAVGQYTGEDGLVPSLSAGMVIWHHLEPLEEALNAARAAEKRAKNVPGKNALCVSVSKRSGSEISVSDSFSAITTRLEACVDAHLANTFSNGVAYRLREMLYELEGMPDAQLSEAKRILNRSQSDPIQIANIVDGLTKASLDAHPQAALLDSVNEILVAKMLADAQRQRLAVEAAPQPLTTTGGAV